MRHWNAVEEMMKTVFRLCAAVCAAVVFWSCEAAAVSSEWPSVVARARGQSVYWHAYAGDERVNRYIEWVAGEVRMRFDIELHHVKVDNIAETVGRLIAARVPSPTAAGQITTRQSATNQIEGPRADLLWINGQNFAALKERGLLFGPITYVLPHFALVDTVHKPTTLLDFTVPTQGMESPWGMAQLVFYADSTRVTRMPETLTALREWTQTHPGRFTYPAPPDFTGLTFVKQVLLDMAEDRGAVYRPVREADFARITAPLWRYLDAMHPYLWREGKVFPQTYPALRQMINAGELDIAFAYNPAEVSSGVANKLLPNTVRPFMLEGGTLGTTFFVAIPAAAVSKDAAMVIADFLLTPEAQSRKAHPQSWGNPTVLDLAKLNAAQRRLFEALPRGKADLSEAELSRVLPEPHPTWTTRLTQEWRKRYAR